MRAHWGEIAAAGFFTTEVWTPRGLVTVYTLFVIDLESRRVQIAGATRFPGETFTAQVALTLTDCVGRIPARAPLPTLRRRLEVHGALSQDAA